MKKKHVLYECANCDQTTVSVILIKRHSRNHANEGVINPSTGTLLGLDKIGFWKLTFVSADKYGSALVSKEAFKAIDNYKGAE